MQLQRAYLIFATPRSGSYLLCEALTNTRLAGRPAEFFTSQTERIFFNHWQFTSKEYDQYFSKIVNLGTTPNGVFGAKLIWYEFDQIIARLRALPGCAHMEATELLATLFSHPHYIYITRRDKLRQAISYARLLQTNEWMRRKDQPAPDGRGITFDLQMIEALLQEIKREEREMEDFFAHNNIQSLTVIYEELVLDYEGTAKKLLRSLEIPFTEPLIFGERRMVRQADEITEEWVQRYRKLKGMSDPEDAHHF